ncbi:MAG: Rv2175c family DNA-binding protein [Thermocrispum sp.]
MGAIPIADDVLAPEVGVIGFDDAASKLGISTGKLRQLLRDGQLIAIKRDGELLLPADFLGEGGPVKGLGGTLTVLADAGFGTTEMLSWLFAADESLPGVTPINALRTHHGTEVKRRAQALGF